MPLSPIIPTIKILKLLLAAAVPLASSVGSLSAQQSTASVHRIGGGVNYWISLKDIDVDDNGFSYLVSYQYRPGLIGPEIAGEFFPDRFGEDAWAPEAYVIVGEGLYGAAGIAIEANRDPIPIAIWRPDSSLFGVRINKWFP